MSVLSDVVKKTLYTFWTNQPWIIIVIFNNLFVTNNNYKLIKHLYPQAYKKKNRFVYCIVVKFDEEYKIIKRKYNLEGYRFYKKNVGYIYFLNQSNCCNWHSECFNNTFSTPPPPPPHCICTFQYNFATNYWNGLGNFKIYTFYFVIYVGITA